MIKTKSLLLSIGMLCGIYSGLYGQQFLAPSPVAAKILGVNQGLSQGMINCIYQDKTGYLWICTKDGLNRYDGYQIVTYRRNPDDPFSLPDNYCNAVVEDDNGNFWVATNTSGLMLFDPATENFYPVQAINSKKENLCIITLQYDDGKLFLKTLKDALLLDIRQVNIKNSMATAANIKLLFDYNQEQSNFKYKFNNNDLSRYFISWVPGNNIWVSFEDSLFFFSPANNFSGWKRTAISPAMLGLENDGKSLYSFFPMPGEPDKLLIGYKNKVIHYDSKNRKILFTKILGETDAGSPLNLFVENDGNIFRVTPSNLFTYHPKTGEAAISDYKNLSLPKGTVFHFFTDRQHIRWYGSAGFGIAAIDPRMQLFKSYNVSRTEFLWNLPATYMPAGSPQLRGFRQVALDKEKIYWAYLPFLNDANNYLYAYDTKTRIEKKLMGLPKGCMPLEIYNDYTDHLWVTYTDSNNKNYIAKVDKSNGSLAATYLIPGNLESPEPFVSQLFLDNDGTMWLATINGLFAYNEKNKIWKQWKNEPQNKYSISGNGVLSICPDPVSPEKYLWLGTEGAGFVRFEKSTGNCLRFDEKDGLPNNVAYCILSDSLNNLWISTNRGLSCFDPANKTFRNFTKEDGLPCNEFNRKTAMLMQNGDLMFGGVDGYVIFNPREVLQKQAAAPLVFTGVAVLNKPIDGKTNSSLNAPIGYANTLTLLPGQNIFSISFATLEYRSNAKKMYKYKLEGFDKDWTSPNSRNEVTYTNLAPGTYTLSVMGANTDGVWNEKPISMKIVVKPYWYQTLLFKFSLLLFLALALYALYRYRLRQVLKLGNLRNRIARDLHDEIGSTLSSISIYAESAKKVTAENQKAKAILSKINDNTSEMMEAMSDIVWAVNSANDHFDELVNRLRSFAVQLTETKKIDLEFTDNKDIPDIALDMVQRKNIYLICKEAINNAVKYADCTLLEVLISKEQRRLQIHIRDNGKGFELENPQAKSPGHLLGGNGLKNMKSRADEMDASLEINTSPGKGTSILLSVPVKKS